MVILFMHIPCTNDHHTIAVRLKRIDWVGSLLFVASLTSFLSAISWGGIVFEWDDWRTVLPLVVGVVGLGSWVVYEEMVAQTPMVPMEIMRNQTAVVYYISTVVHGIAYFGMLYYLPLYYQAVRGYSSLVSGLALLPQCLGAGLFAILVGVLIAKNTSLTRHLVLIGWTVFALGLALLHILDVDTTVVQWIFINIPAGIGMGMLFAGLAMATQAATELQGATVTSEQQTRVSSNLVSPTTPLPARTEADSAKSQTEHDHKRAIAAGLNPFFRALGQSLGIVIGQSTFTNEMKKRLGSSTAKDAAEIAQMIDLAHSEPARYFTFVGSLRSVWWVLFAIAMFALLLTFLAKSPKRQPRIKESSGDVEANAQTVDEHPVSRDIRDIPASPSTVVHGDWASFGGGSPAIKDEEFELRDMK